MSFKKYFAVLLAAVMAFSAVTLGSIAAQDNVITAYAATLSAPSVKASNASYKSVKLTWKKVKGAKKYTVMRSAKKSSGYKALKTVTKTSYTDSKATCGKTYYYKVVAVNGSKKKTSKAVKIKCVPAKVTSVAASSAACSQVTVSFKAVSGAGGYDIAYSSTPNGTFKSVATVKATSYTHSIGAGCTGSYKVRAYRTVKGKKIYGAYSSVVTATALSHSYGEWGTVSAATCVQCGVEAAACVTCGDVIYRSTSATGVHSYGSYTVEKRATCAEAGTKYTVCSVCGDKQYATVAPTNAHSYTYSSTATCTEDGQNKRTCTVCGKEDIVSEAKATGHPYKAEVTAPTCTEQGYTTYTCETCGDVKTADYTDALGHDFSGEIVSNNDDTHSRKCVNGCGESSTEDCQLTYTLITPSTETQSGEGCYTCTVCGYENHITINPGDCSHTELTTESYVAPTCTEIGYSGDKYCTFCGLLVEKGAQLAPLGHTGSASYTAKTDTATNETHLFDICCVCGEEYETDTFCLDITDIATRDLSQYSGVAQLSAAGKLTLTATKYVDNFELSGTAENLTISVDAFEDAQIKLCGLTIANSTRADDCIRINDKCTDMKATTDESGNPITDAAGNPVTEKVVPTVSISAKDGTENTLRVTVTGGKAIQCEPKLELKGHGTLNTDTVSTCINARAKLYIKNINMNIKSGNRGIDTKLEIKDESGNVIDTDYSNITFGGNAVIKVNSTDDGIRCKNMEFEALSDGDTDTAVTIESGQDAIQLEGKKGLTMYQGTVTLKGSKSTLNNKSGIAPALSGTAQLIEL